MNKLMVMLAVAMMAAVVGAQTLKVSVSELKASGSIRGGATAQAFTVLNSGTGTSYYTVTDDVAWMSIAPASGSSTNEGDQIVVTFDTTNLDVGNHTGTITITQTNAPVTVKTIAVTLVIDTEISNGVILGPAFALTPTSVAIADRGASLASARAAGAVQIGPGVNSTANTLQFRGMAIADASGLVAASISPAAVTTSLSVLVPGGTTSVVTIVNGRITAITP